MGSKKGSITIEASVALTAFMFIVLMILSFATVYMAHSIVSHATLQTSQTLAIESYYRETVSDSKSVEDLADKMLKFVGLLGFDTSGIISKYASLGDGSTDFYSLVESTFAYSIAGDIDTADQLLENLGLPDGLDGIDFSYSSVSGGDVIINVQYEVELLFPFFGEKTLNLSKSAKTKAFKQIKGNNGYVEAGVSGIPS